MPLEPLKQKIKVEPDGVQATMAGLARSVGAYDESVEAATSKTSGLLGRIKTLAKSGKAWLVGTLLTGVAAVSAAIATATAKAVGFENQLNEVRKTAGLTEREFVDLQGRLLEIQADLGTSQQELAGIAAQAGRLGVESPDDIASFTRTVAMMADATVVSADKAAQGLGQLLNAFQQDITEAQRFGAVINELSNNAAADTQQIISAVQRMGGAANALGLSADEAAAFATTLQDLGINARQSGTTLRSVFGRILPQAERVGEIMGMTEQEVVQAFEENGREAILSFLEELEEMDQLARANAIQDLFGVRQSSRVALLVQNIGELRTQIGRAAEESRNVNSLTEEFNETTKDVANEWGRLTAKLSSWVTDFGSNFTGMLETVLSKLNDVLGGVEEVRRDLIDAQTRMSSVAEVEKLIEKYQRLKKENKDTTEVVEELQSVVGDEFFRETADGAEPLIGKMQELVDLRREAAEESLEEQQADAVERLNASFLELRRARIRQNELGEGEVEQWKELQGQIQGANEDIDSLAKTLVSDFADGMNVNREALRDFLETQTSAFGAFREENLGERIDNLIARYRELQQVQDDGGEGTGTDGEGGAGGPSSNFDSTDFQEAQRKLREALQTQRRERRLSAAATQEERDTLQDIFDLQGRINTLEQRRAQLAEAAIGATGAQKDQVEDLRDETEEMIDDLERRKDQQEEILKGLTTGTVGPSVIDPEKITDVGEKVGESLQEAMEGVDLAGVEGDGSGFGILLEGYNQRLTELRSQLERGEIDAQEFAARSRSAAKRYRRELEEIIEKLEEMGLLSAEEAEAAVKALQEMGDEADETGEKVSEVGENIQDTARLVRGIGDLASQFGDLSDGADAAIQGTASVLDNVGRIVELTERGDVEGFADIFSSFGSGVSGASALIGAAGGLTTMIQPLLQDQGPDFNELRSSIRDNVDALEENTNALLDEGQIGEDVSEKVIAEAQAVFDEYLAAVEDRDHDEVDNLLDELSRFDFISDQIPDLVDNMLSALFERVDSDDFSDIDTDQAATLVNQLVSGQISPAEFVTAAGETDFLDESDAQELLDLLPDDFEPIGSILDSLGDDLGEFSDSVSGAIDQLDLMRQFGDSEAPENFQTFMDTIVQQASGDFQETLEEIASLDIDSEEGREQLSELIASISDDLAAGDLDLGSLTPNQVEDILGELETFTEQEGESGSESFSTSASVSRTITEHQANQLLSFQRELVQQGQQRNLILDYIAGEVGSPDEVPSPEGLSSASSNGTIDADSLTGSLMQADGAELASHLRSMLDRGDRSRTKHVENNAQTITQNIEINIDGNVDGREIARKIENAIRRRTPGRRSQ